MTKAAAVGCHVLVWLSRISLWIGVAALVIALFELAYFGAGYASLFGCVPKNDTLFYFSCGQTPNVILAFLLNLPMLFVYAGTSTMLGFPSGGSFVVLFYVLDAIFLLALLRLLYLLYAGARRLTRGSPQQRFPKASP